MLYFMYVAWLFGKKSDLLWEAYLNFFLTESRQQKAALIRMDGVDGKLLLEEDLRLQSPVLVMGSLISPFKCVD